MGTFVRHEPCPECGSSNALARYDNGTATCFKCDHYDKGEGNIPEEAPTQSKDWTPIHGEYTALTKRGIDEATCKLYEYQVGTYNGKPCHIANIRDEKRKLIAQKIRLPGKQFVTLGNGKDLPLIGMWLYSGGKHLVITEGEADMLSMSKAFENKWPAVSLPNGAQSAAKAIKRCYDWLENFDRIVLMFDMDEPGQAAALEVAAMLPPGRAAIAQLPEKDANDVLLKHGKAALIRSFWDAPFWKPDGIRDGTEFSVEDLMSATAVGFDLPYPLLQEKSLGLRKGELTLVTAGSGIGKSTWSRELAYHLNQKYGLGIGNVFLEESNKKTAQAYVAIHNNVPLGLLRAKPDLLTVEQWTDGVKKVVHNRMKFYDHFGSLESDKLISKLRYLAQVEKVDFIILDHISIVVSGAEGSGQGERRDIDMLMTSLRSLIEATGVGVLAVVHLKRVTGKTFNEGDQVSLSDLRGSASLEQLSDNVWALERDQQADGPKGLQARIRVLKGRETGDTGEADLLEYDRKTGRLQLSSSDCPFGEVT